MIELLLFFFTIGGLLVLSPLEDDRLFGSLHSMSCTFWLMSAASGQCLAILCSSAVVDDVLNRPRARRRRPWLRHASTAEHRDVTEPDSSWTNFRVTASSMICFTSFLTVAISRSFWSSATEELDMTVVVMVLVAEICSGWLDCLAAAIAGIVDSNQSDKLRLFMLYLICLRQSTRTYTHKHYSIYRPTGTGVSRARCPPAKWLYMQSRSVNALKSIVESVFGN